MFKKLNDVIRFMGLQIIVIIIFSLFYYLIGRKTKTHFLVRSRYGHRLIKLSLIDALFLSVTTQSTIGYGSITPISPIAKTISIIQMILIYLFIGGEILF